MLDNLVSEELIRLNIEATDWQEAVRLAAQPLIDSGKIKPGYVDAIIENVKENGPYIVITPGVALPHAKAESEVLASALGIATLKTPINFGNRDNDPVKYVFCLSSTGNQEHLNTLMDLANLLEQKEFYDVLDKAESAKEIVEFLNK